MTITFNVESDEPVLVLVVPLRKAAPRSVPPMSARQIIETTGEPVGETSNVVPFRKAAA